MAFALITGPEDNAGQANRTMFSVVYSEKLSDSWSYVAQWDQAYQQPTATNYTTANGLPPQRAEWWGINQYLFYTVNCSWKAGLRYFLFDDDDGVRVQGQGTPRGIPLLAQPRRYQAVSLGAYYKPDDKLLVRSECRWDWSQNLVPGVAKPFDDYTKNHQFLWTTDVVLLW